MSDRLELIDRASVVWLRGVDLFRPTVFVFRNHFAHRAQITELEFKRLLKQSRTSLLIGLLFLAACLFLSKMLLGHEADTWAAVVRERLTIAGWVAMWRPMQIYLYDW